MGLFSVSSLKIAGESLSLKDDAIVCFVGQNNSGKTSSLLAIEKMISGGGTPPSSHLSAAEIKFNEATQSLEKIDDYFETDGSIWRDKRYPTRSRDSSIARSLLNKEAIPGKFNTRFIAKIDLNARQSAISNGAMVSKTGSLPETALQHLAAKPELERKLSLQTNGLFGFDISLCAGAVQGMTLHIGNRIDPEPHGGDRAQSYFSEVSKLRAIDLEGDGVKCAVGLLAACINRAEQVYFFDEPDLYLHPPQAYETARILTEVLEHKQLFIATHSAKFIQGLAAAAKERLVIIRLERERETAQAHVVENAVFSDVKADPILAFTNIFDGFFHSQIILCEDEADCLFYRATATRVLGEDAFKNALWLGVNGKSAFKKTASIASRMKVPFMVIADFDLLRNFDDELKPLVEIKGMDVAEIEAEVSWLKNQEQNDAKVTWKELKENGVRAFSHNASYYQRVEALLKKLNENGILINRYGEVEHLREPKLEQKGVECISAMLREEVETSRNYDDLRKFWEELKGCAIHAEPSDDTGTVKVIELPDTSKTAERLDRPMPATRADL